MRGLDHEARCSPPPSPSRSPGRRLAQAPAARQPRRPAPEAAPGAADAARPPLDVELETGGYAYNSQGGATRS